MTATAQPTEAPRDLNAELAEARRQLAEAEAEAVAIAGEEENALASDVTYASFIRRGKVQAKEVERRRAAVTAAKIAVDDDLARGELEAAEQDYADTAARNRKLLEERLPAFRRRVVPEILDLLAALARDQIDCERVNNFVASSRRIQNADAAARSMPAINSKILSSEVVNLWTIQGGRILTDQDAVQFDDNGQAFVAQGGAKFWAVQKQFLRVEEQLFSPARGSKPLWQSIVIPGLSLSDAAVYEGPKARSPADAIRMLKAAENEALTTYTVRPATKVSFEPLDADGNEIRPVSIADAPPEPPEIREESIASASSLLPPAVRRG